jgi:deaminated glutathione amidase
MLVDPFGVVRADLGPVPRVVVTDVDPELVDEVRKTVPSLTNRRADIFGR